MAAMQAAGMSPWRLARPVLVFGIVAGVLVGEDGLPIEAVGEGGEALAAELDGPTMDDLYDDDCVDYPETLLPFAGHPGWNGLDEDRRSRVRAWGWIAYNKNVVDIEQDVVTPGFGLLFRDAFGTGFSDAGRAAVVQSMVDEEYPGHDERDAGHHGAGQRLTEEKPGGDCCDGHSPG